MSLEDVPHAYFGDVAYEERVCGADVGNSSGVHLQQHIARPGR